MKIPLDPGAGGRCIASPALRLADIVVSTTSQVGSRLIRAGTFSEVSHAAVYIGDDLVVESIADGGVVQRGLYESLGQSNLGVAYRRPGLTSMQAMRVRDYLGRQLGKPYDFAGVAGFGLRTAAVPAAALGHPGVGMLAIVAEIIGRGEDRFFCSELVVAAFKHAGAPLTSSEPVRTSPGNLANLGKNGTLEYVGHLLTP